MICPKIRFLHLEYTLWRTPPKDPAPWLETVQVPALQELRVHLANHLTTSVASVSPLEKWWQQTEQLDRAEEMGLEQAQELPPQAERWLTELMLRSVVFTRTHWHEWLQRLGYLETFWQSSLEVTLSMQEEAHGFIWDTIEGSSFLGLPRLMELTTILNVFPGHLPKLCLHGCGIPVSLTPIHLPSLIILDVNAEGFDYLLIMRYVRVPQLRDLQVPSSERPRRAA